MKETVASMRTRAELARRLSAELKEAKVSATLREIADNLDAEADKLESNVVPLRPEE